MLGITQLEVVKNFGFIENGHFNHVLMGLIYRFYPQVILLVQLAGIERYCWAPRVQLNVNEIILKILKVTLNIDVWTGVKFDPELLVVYFGAVKYPRMNFGFIFHKRNNYIKFLEIFVKCHLIRKSKDNIMILKLVTGLFTKHN